MSASAMTSGYYAEGDGPVEPGRIRTWKGYCCRMWIMPWLGSAAPSAGNCGICGKQPQPKDKAYFVGCYTPQVWDDDCIRPTIEQQAYKAIERFIEGAGMLRWEAPRVEYIECQIITQHGVDYVPLAWITERDQIIHYKVCWVARAVKLDD